MPDTTSLRVADLPQNTPTTFELRPDPAAQKALADELGLSGLRKLRFAGQVAAQGARDWELTGTLGATVVQPCVVTLEPVTTRIDVDVRRLYVADLPEVTGDEVEMPEDDSVERLAAVIDPGAVMAEALALALPLYPRKAGTEATNAVFAQKGIKPMSDDDARPFAGLAELRDALKKDS
ncbi:YceD family protein [Microbulbifer sp. S227A]|uniref:YceD family protein n=1 Tax=Microbulbifer sp. S227A TaxID=3415131 RepID=UPI003C7A5250